MYRYLLEHERNLVHVPVVYFSNHILGGIGDVLPLLEVQVAEHVLRLTLTRVPARDKHV